MKDTVFYRSIEMQAKKDAKRYAEAELNYGKGSGNRRKIVDAEIRPKLENDIYRKAFNKALDELDSQPILKKIKISKNIQTAMDTAKRIDRNGRRLYSIYSDNKEFLNDIFDAIARRILK